MQQLLVKSRPTTHLDHTVLYLASAHWKVDILVAVLNYLPANQGKPIIHCEHIGPGYEHSILLIHTLRGRVGHYECVESEGTRYFSSDHELVAAFAQLSRDIRERAPPAGKQQSTMSCNAYTHNVQLHSQSLLPHQPPPSHFRPSRCILRWGTADRYHYASAITPTGLLLERRW